MKLRILIATNAPLESCFGAGQVAINLSQAFRDLGHEVILWSPVGYEIESTVWVQKIFPQFGKFFQNRAKLNSFLRSQAEFDIVDISNNLITDKACRAAPVVVARSVQPSLLYLWEGIKGEMLSRVGIKRIMTSIVAGLVIAIFTIISWARATHIFCLGTSELNWMSYNFPWFKEKLFVHFNTISESEQSKLKIIRDKRKLDKSIKGIRFLWIGRWDHHKGTENLLNFMRNRLHQNSYDNFTIAGCGEIAIENYLKDINASNRVDILPKFNRDCLIDLLEIHDVGLFTSNVEGWGLVLNEMLESGMTVFATKSGGVLDLISTFPNLLHEFPPANSFSKEDIATLPFPGSYYENFTWNEIARKYLATVEI